MSKIISYNSKIVSLLVFMICVAFNSTSFADSGKLDNGSFEEGLDNWANNGKVDVITGTAGWSIDVGERAVDLNGTGSSDFSDVKGIISQTFDTVQDGKYTGSYALNAHCQCRRFYHT